MSLDAPTAHRIPWRRWWVGISETPTLRNGYLVSPDERDWNHPRQSANLNHLDDLAAVPCLVLVGPPGLGKSNELRVEHTRSRTLSFIADREVLHVDLKTHGDLSFREEVFESDAYLGWARGEHPLTLFLDSLDECWARIGALIPTLVRELRRAGLGRDGHPPLLLRLGCRAAEWRNEELARLRAAFDDLDGKKNRAQVHQLCPLSRDGTVTPDHDLHRLGSYLLNHLNSLDSAEAVMAVEALLTRRPEHADWLGRILAQVRRARRRQDWQALHPSEAVHFLDGLAPRPIATLGDLCDAVLASLAHYQSRLRGLTPPTELWNEPTRRGRRYWEPKDENVLSNCLANHLRQELGGRKVMVEREVEVRRGTPAEPGDNPDLVILAPNPSIPAEPLRLYLEVKCAWNVEAITGLGEQLFHRYLRTAECGIYLLAHYDCPAWNAPKDHRKNRALNPKPKAEVATQLQAELERLRLTAADKRIEACFLDAAR